jgi:hypothetical protein
MKRKVTKQQYGKTVGISILDRGAKFFNPVAGELASAWTSHRWMLWYLAASLHGGTELWIPETFLKAAVKRCLRALAHFQS